jgi:hypothetical protein
MHFGPSLTRDKRLCLIETNMDGRSCTYDWRIISAVVHFVDLKQELALWAPIQAPGTYERMARFLIERGADANEPDDAGT